MALQNPSIANAAQANVSSGPRSPAKPTPSDGRFGSVLSQVMPNAKLQVQSGDTLIGLVKAQHRQQGQPVSENQAFKLAHLVAADNQLAHADRIRTGQRLDFSRLDGLGPQRQPAASNGLPNAAKAVANALSSPLEPPVVVKTALNEPTEPNSPAHPVLEQVLGRAQAKGFIPTPDLAGVRSKILQLADKHQFLPDDFARLSLMESGGMNPQASNGHCHGIIQFCDGPGRGAAAVGFPTNPKAILGLSLYKQLDLVDRYLDKVASPAKADASAPGKPAKMDLADLYLSILSPAARSEQRPDAPLAIGGPQASLLHVGQNPRNPITRNSLVAGLHTLAQTLLSGNRPKAPARLYAEVANPTDPGLDW